MTARSVRRACLRATGGIRKPFGYLGGIYEFVNDIGGRRGALFVSDGSRAVRIDSFDEGEVSSAVAVLIAREIHGS
jgi:hypothetical protein